MVQLAEIALQAASVSDMNNLDQASAIGALVDELGRCGVSGAVLAPGSRSAPLVLELASNERIACWSQIDERAAGFFALGLAKATGKPAIVCTTSGTAAVELAPAVAEAFESRIPLIVITADRPPELRDIGEGQTVDQIKLFGSMASFQELPSGNQATEQWWRSSACRAFWTALGQRQGPVHLNFPLRKPLTGQSQTLTGGRSGGLPWLDRVPGSPNDASEAISNLLTTASRPIIVAGQNRRSNGRAVAAFAERLAIPLLADQLSSARKGEAAISHWDAMLRSNLWATDTKPDLILRFGDLPSSPAMREWLSSQAEDQIPIVQFDSDLSWRDPTSSTSIRIESDVKTTLAKLSDFHFDPEWIAHWHRSNRVAAAALKAVIDFDSNGLSEPLIAATVHSSLSAEIPLFTAASMPIRDLDNFSPISPLGREVVANRGANGIDGTIATTAGFAAVRGTPVALICGDVAFAYDLTSLSAIRESRQPILIVVIDNGGGGIFDSLPVSAEGEHYERFIATPPRLDIEVAGKPWGIDTISIGDLQQLESLLTGFGVDSEPMIVRIETSRSAQPRIRAEAWAAVDAAVSSEIA